MGSYIEYKTCTEKFKSWLFSLEESPRTNEKSKITCSILLKKIEYLENAAIQIPLSILHCLKRAIYLRIKSQNFMNSKGLGDSGHVYFIKTLKECLNRLLHLQKKNSGPKVKKNDAYKESPTNIHNENTTSKNDNRYACLIDNHEENDETLSLLSCIEHEEQLHISKKNDSIKTQNKKPCTIFQNNTKNNIEDDDVFDDEIFLQGTFFLLDLFRLNSFVENYWKKCRDSSNLSLNEQRLQFIQATAMTNVAIRLISQLSNAIELEYPYLNTIEKIVTCVFFREVIYWLRLISPEIPYSIAIDAITCSWELVWFSQKTEFEKIVEMTQLPLIQVSELIRRSTLCFQSLKLKKTWMEFRLLNQFLKHMTEKFFENQPLASTIEFETCLSDWDENKNPASTILDLQEYLLKELILEIREEIYQRETYTIPYLENELDLMQTKNIFKCYFEKNQVTMTLVCATAFLLRSILILQGQNRCTRFAIQTMVDLVHLKQKYEYVVEFTQCLGSESAQNLSALTGAQIASAWLSFVINRDKRSCFSKKLVQRRMYCPYIAGQHLLMASLGISSSSRCIKAIDALFQCRIVVHLYNMLHIVIPEKMERIALLENLQKRLEVSKEFFPGGRPKTKGSFFTGALLSIGSPNTKIQVMKACVYGPNSSLYNFSTNGRRRDQNFSYENNTNNTSSLKDKWRPKPIKSTDLFLSYNYLINGEFYGLRDCQNLEQMMYTVEKCLVDDYEMINTNFLVVSQIFVDLLNKILEDLKIRKWIKDEVEVATALSLKKAPERVKLMLQFNSLLVIFAIADNDTMVNRNNNFGLSMPNDNVILNNQESLFLNPLMFEVIANAFKEIFKMKNYPDA